MSKNATVKGPKHPPKPRTKRAKRCARTLTELVCGKRQECERITAEREAVRSDLARAQREIERLKAERDSAQQREIDYGCQNAKLEASLNAVNTVLDNTERDAEAHLKRSVELFEELQAEQRAHKITADTLDAYESEKERLIVALDEVDAYVMQLRRERDAARAMLNAVSRASDVLHDALAAEQRAHKITAEGAKRDAASLKLANEAMEQYDADEHKLIIELRLLRAERDAADKALASYVASMGKLGMWWHRLWQLPSLSGALVAWRKRRRV